LLRNPRALSFLLVALGLGLIAWYGDARWRSPQWSEAQLEEETQLRLAVELHRRGPHLQPDAERLRVLHRTLRAEVDAELQRGRQELERWIGVGALLCVLGGSHFLKQLLAARARAN
jgi:hypothetical protein